jgi:hypothetical protein
MTCHSCLCCRLSTNKDKYFEEVQKSIEESLHLVYQPRPANCMLVFTEPKPAHDIIREKILSEARDEDGESSHDCDVCNIIV